jgi:Fe-S oxidoreductase
MSITRLVEILQCNIQHRCCGSGGTPIYSPLKSEILIIKLLKKQTKLIIKSLFFKIKMLVT